MLMALRSTSALLGLIAASALAGAQSSALPPTAVTANAMPAPISASSVGTRDASARHRARITYAGGLLDVRADNSSLNGILRDIAQATGMKVTGGVNDQRVFGNYGPAEPATVLATLLDGTGTNMLLRETADNGPRELILTPRTGGVTPPNPNAQNYDGDSDSIDEAAPSPAPQQAAPVQAPLQGNPVQRPFGPQSIPQPMNNVLGSPDNVTQTPSTLPTYQSVPTDSISTPSVAQQPQTGIVDSLNPPPAGSTTFGSSTPTNLNSLGDGTPKTPDQIYQQLQQMRQQSQQQQQPASNSGSSTPQ